MAKAVCDIIIALPDNTVAITWQFFEGTTWPRSDSGSLLFKGKVEMFIIKSDAVKDIVSDNQRLLRTMRAWYEEGSPVTISNTVPIKLTEKDKKDLIFGLLDFFIMYLTLPVTNT